MPRKFTDLEGLKKRTLRFFKTLAAKKGWKYDVAKIDGWSPWRWQRSFYTLVQTKDGKKAFFKYPVAASSRKTFLREMTFLEYLNRKCAGLTTQIYDISKKKGEYWSLVEHLDLKKGVLVDGEKTKVLKPKYISWILSGISRIEALPGRGEFQRALWKHSFSQNADPKFRAYKSRVNKFLRHVEAHKSAAPGFPLADIRDFIKEHETDFRKAERGSGILLQGDMAPNNLFIDLPKKRVVFLDWEYASINKNEELYKAFDFANTYFRLWQNPTFQRVFLKEYMRKKLATKAQLKAACILQSLRQIKYLVDPKYDVESGAYLVRHKKGITNALIEVLRL